MNSAAPARRFRTLLDCFLVLLLLLVISAKDQPALGGVDMGGVSGWGTIYRALTTPALTTPAQTMVASPRLAGVETGGPGAHPDEVGRNMPSLDNNTLAAMIAAENAALTLPQYGVNLPVITR